MTVRHRDFIHCYEARDPGREEQRLRDHLNDKPPVEPGHFNRTLGCNVAVSTKRNPHSGMSRTKLKSRVTLAKVWE